MDKPRTRQSGFSVLEGLLVALAIVVLAGVSVVVYQHNRTKVTSAAPNSHQISNQQATTTSPGTTVGYLTIKEWGVKIPLSSGISDAYYVMSTTSWRNPDGLPSTAWLSLKSFTSAACNPTNNDKGGRGAIGAILRVPPTLVDQISGQPYTQEYPNGITIGGYYYAYESWASGNPCATQAALQPVDSAFAAAGKIAAQATAN